MSDPVSWLVIERGWQVIGSDDSELGTIHEVVGDSGEDIFNGLTVSPGLLRGSRYVPAERVASIVQGCVRLDVGEVEFEHLDEAGPQPPSAHVRPDTTDLPADDR